MGPDILALALHRISFLKTSEKMFLRELFSDPRQLVSQSLQDLSGLLGRRIRTDRWKPEDVVQGAQKDAEALEDGTIRCVSIGDSAYPPQLAEIFDPPYLLFYRGQLPAKDRPHLAVVGTRYPTCGALDTAFDLAFQAADTGLPVVSGLALGIDTAAHQGALHGGGVTVAVLGCGCDRIYPRSSTAVGYGILSAGGCLVSEFPPGTEPLPFHFPQRNRIISGLSRGVVVVQAPERSGALITADFALEQGRDLFIVPELLEGPLNQGCRALAESGAPGIQGISDILKEWEISTDRGKRVYETMTEGSVGSILAHLLEEEIAGTAVRYRGKVYRRMYQHG